MQETKTKYLNFILSWGVVEISRSWHDILDSSKQLFSDTRLASYEVLSFFYSKTSSRAFLASICAKNSNLRQDSVANLLASMIDQDKSTELEKAWKVTSIFPRMIFLLKIWSLSSNGRTNWIDEVYWY